MPYRDRLEAFSTRLPPSLLRQVKVHCAAHGVLMQEFIRAALAAAVRRPPGAPRVARGQGD